MEDFPLHTMVRTWLQPASACSESGLDGLGKYGNPLMFLPRCGFLSSRSLSKYDLSNKITIRLIPFRSKPMETSGSISVNR